MKESKKIVFGFIILILLVLLVIGIVMVVKSNNEKVTETNSVIENEFDDKTVNNQSINIELSEEEQNKIEKYITKICNSEKWNIVRLPTFDKLENADKEWIYSHIRSSNDSQYVTATEIQNQIQEIFGSKLVMDIEADQKNIPNDRMSFIPRYDENEEKYLITPYGDALSFMYAISDIKKENNKYVIEVIEYCPDIIDRNVSEIDSAIYTFGENQRDEMIFKLEIDQNPKDSKVIEQVIQNKDKFQTYNITLNEDNDTLIVESIKK